MTENRARKRAIRERMAATGEPYSVAARKLAATQPAPGRVRVVAIESGGKGGVGKTTVALELTRALGRRGRRPLLVDLDPMGFATTAVLGDLGPGGPTLAGALTSTVSVAELPRVGSSGLKVIPSWGLGTYDGTAALTRLAELLAATDPRFTDVVLDCPPGGSQLTPLAREAVTAGATGGGVLLIAMPDPVSLQAASAPLAPAAPILGLVINRTRDSMIDASLHDVPRRLRLPVLARIPWAEAGVEFAPAPVVAAVDRLAEILTSDQQLAAEHRRLRSVLEHADTRDKELQRLLSDEATRLADGPYADADPEFDLGLHLLDDRDAYDRISALVDGPDDEW